MNKKTSQYLDTWIDEHLPKPPAYITPWQAIQYIDAALDYHNAGNKRRKELENELASKQ